MTIDLIKLVKHLLKYCWIILLCAVIGFGGMYLQAKRSAVDTYVADATLYVYNGNPNMVNYSYTNIGDLNSAVALLDTYKVVINSNKVMDVVVERLAAQYPSIQASYIISTLSIASVNETGVMRISCRTPDAQMSADICNAVVDAAPQEIIRVVGAGGIEVIDYAMVPKAPVRANLMRSGIMGALAGAVLCAGILVVIFLMNQKVRDAKELTDSLNVPLLAEIPRQIKSVEDNEEWKLLLNNQTPVATLEAYNRLRMNLGFALTDKRKLLLVSSALSGEGKSTIAANLALTYARAGKHVLLIDGDMRRSRQEKYFLEERRGEREYTGLSNLIIGEFEPEQVLYRNVEQNLDLITAGSVPPNPSELLGSDGMKRLLTKLEQRGYDIIIMDMPPINIVSDPLVLAEDGASMLYVVRQDYSDHREIRKALAAIELAEMELLGMTFYGERTTETSRAHYHHYSKYYHAYGSKKPYDYNSSGNQDDKWVLRSDNKNATTPNTKDGTKRRGEEE